MLSWLLKFVLTALAIRLLARTVGRSRPAPRPFDPTPDPRRGKPRDGGRFRAGDIDDAEYEELPRR